MNENQLFADAALIRTIELQSVATWLLSGWLRKLDELQRDIQAAIALHDPTDAGSAALELLLEDVREKIRDVFTEIEARATESFDEIGQIQAAHEREQMLLIFGIIIPFFTLIRAADLEVNGVKVSEWLKRTAGDLELRVTSLIRRGVTGGDGIGKLIERLKGGSDADIQTPAVAPSKTSIATLTRTAVESIAARTRENAGAALVEVNPPTQPEAEPDKPAKAINYGWQQISVLDGRTTQICRNYAFKIWDLNFKPIRHSLPYDGGVPRHHYCRSSIVLILLDSDPAKVETFTEWMERQTEEKKRKIFGSKAYELWKAKKIADSDLIRSEDRQLTFEQLKNRK